jgi:hypothetical protein
MVQLVTYFLCAVSVFGTVYLIRSRGLRDGGGIMMMIGILLIPCWMEVKLPVMGVDPRSLFAMAFLAGSLLQPFGERRPLGWRFPDLLILMLVAAMTVSQVVARSVSPLAPFTPLRELVLPYLVGRIYFRSPREIERILPILCKCLTLAAALAAVEAITKKNPLELVWGRPWLTAAVADQEFDMVRWGLKRAYSVQTHPIYLGLTFAMMLPWAIEAAVQSFQRRGPMWWRLMPVITLVGVVATGSRAAQICSIFVMALTFCQAVPRVRPLAVMLVCLGGLCYTAFRAEFVDALQNYAQEGKEGEEYVKIKGVQREYSGTKHRDLLFEVYEESIDGAGWFGYGAELSNSARDPEMDEKFASIDNHFLLFFLQYGYVGITIFAVFAAVVLWGLVPVSLGAVGPPGRLAAGLLGAIGGCLLSMRGVWFAGDFAWVWLWCAGWAVSLSSWYREARAIEGYTRA